MIKVGDVYRKGNVYWRIELVIYDVVYYVTRKNGGRYLAGSLRSCTMTEAIEGTDHMVKVKGGKP